MAYSSNKMPSIRIVGENINHLSRLGVLQRVKLPADNETNPFIEETNLSVNEPNSSASETNLSTNRPNLADKNEFINKFINQTRYFVEEVLPHEQKLNNFWFCLLVKRCRITTCVMKETKSVIVNYNFLLSPELHVIVSEWTNELVLLNKLLYLTFGGTNFNPKWRFVCRATMDSAKIMFEWKYENKNV